MTLGNYLEGKVFSTAEIEELLDVSRSSLRRWEQDGILPPVKRDMSNQRQYTMVHIRAIVKKKLDEFTVHFSKQAKSDDDEGVGTLWAGSNEAISLLKFFGGDIGGLYELGEYPKISSETILKLLDYITSYYDVDSEVFQEVIRVIYEQTRQKHIENM